MRKYTRRQVLVRATGLGAGAIGVMLSIPALGFLLSPLFIKPRTSGWITVGPIDDIPIDAPTPRFATLPNEQGWPTPAEQRVVYVVRRSDGTTLALSNICTHMQCDVHWDTNLRQFLCPCHGGLYDMNGTNVGGPPPQPLAQWTHRITYDPTLQAHILEIQDQLDEHI
jgi:menaquinol-cytochrome c reductase iron-sulfur subunit